jgi:hypothetical protein
VIGSGVVSTRPSGASTCDIDRIHAQAQQSLPDYTVDGVRVDRGIVTLLLSARNGAGSFSVALHASGTQLASSVDANQVDASAIARASETTSMWWQNPAIQDSLLACSGEGAARVADDIGDRLRLGAEAALPRSARTGNDTIPRALALTLAVLQVTIVVAVIIRAITSHMNAPDSGYPFSWAALVLIAVVAFVVARRFGGPSALVWSDTFNDQAEVQRCLERSECTIYGIGTSVPGFVHAGGWLQLRDLLSVMGLSLDQQILLLQMLDAVGVMLAAMTAWFIGGPIAAAVATWAVWCRYSTVGVAYYALYNSLPMAFLGAVFLAACVNAVQRPTARSVAAAGFVGAILANVHFAGVACGITSALIGTMAPKGRVRFALIGAAAFSLGAVLISPATWLHAATYVLSHPTGERREIATVPLTAEPLVVDGLWLTAVWVVAALAGGRFRNFRRRLGPEIAIIAPPVVMFTLAALTGRINPTGKYVAQLRAPVAVALAVIVSSSLEVLGSLAVGTRDRLSPRWRATFNALIQIPPYVGALALLTSQPNYLNPVALRLKDIEAAARILREDLGWDFETAVRNLKAPDNHDVLAAWKLMYPEWVRGSVRSDERDQEDNAVLLRVSVHDLPNPIPREWRIVSAYNTEATIVAMVPSWIDWSAYTVCVVSRQEGPEHCTDTGLVDPSSPYSIDQDVMPDSGAIFVGDILRLRFSLRNAPPGEVHRLFMPHHPSQMCSGRIIAVPAGSRIEAEGRQATLVSPFKGPDAPAVVLEWDLSACRGGYSGFPPFFLEGPTNMVGPLAELLRKSWEH